MRVNYRTGKLQDIIFTSGQTARIRRTISAVFDRLRVGRDESCRGRAGAAPAYAAWRERPARAANSIRFDILKF